MVVNITHYVCTADIVQFSLHTIYLVGGSKNATRLAATTLKVH